MTDTPEPPSPATANANTKLPSEEANGVLGQQSDDEPLTPEQFIETWTAISPFLRDWANRYHGHQLNQYEASHVYNTYGIWLGLPVVILTAIVGTGIFATYSKDADPMIRLVIGTISIVSTSLAAVQSFLRYPEAAAKHRSAAIQYGVVKRDIEAELALPVAVRTEPRRFLRGIAARLDAINSDAPDVPDRIYARVKRKEALRQASTMPMLEAGKPTSPAARDGAASGNAP